MNGAAVFLIAFFTSLVTSVGTLYLSERLDIFGDPQAETVEVPNVEGLPQSDAAANLKNAGLVLMIYDREPSAEVKEGTVLRQTLLAGQTVTRGQIVGLTLATALAKVPSVVGKSVEDAAAVLKEAGYQIKAEQAHHATIPKGQIVSQNPESGAGLKEDGTVVVQVSDGPGEVEVPNLIGVPYAAAKKTLEELGLEAKVRWVDLAETSSGIVLSQTPAKAEKAEPGSEVVIVINRE
jgi:serine/threonine-protein kinase